MAAHHASATVDDEHAVRGPGRLLRRALVPTLQLCPPVMSTMRLLAEGDGREGLRRPAGSWPVPTPPDRGGARPRGAPPPAPLGTDRLRRSCVPPPPPRRPPATATALAAPVCAGLVGLWLGETSLAVSLALWVEPLIWGLALYAVLSHLVARRWATAGAFALGCVVGVALLHLPPEPRPVDPVEASWSERLRECASLVERGQGPVRVVSWTLSAPLQPVDLDTIAAQTPDLVALQGHGLESAAQELARRLDGESKLLMGDGGRPVALVARGAFRVCGAAEDIWEMPLPAWPTGSARVLLTFPEVVNVGIVLFLVVQLDQPRADWRLLAHGGAGRRPPRGRPESGPRVPAPRRGGRPRPPGLPSPVGPPDGGRAAAAPAPATWPARIGAVQALPVHPLEQVWHGDAWAAGPVYTLDAPPQGREGLAVTLSPD